MNPLIMIFSAPLPYPHSSRWGLALKNILSALKSVLYSWIHFTQNKANYDKMGYDKYFF